MTFAWILYVLPEILFKLHSMSNPPFLFPLFDINHNLPDPELSMYSIVGNVVLIYSPIYLSFMHPTNSNTVIISIYLLIF